MSDYPVTLVNLERGAIVIGGGEVAARKVAGLLAAGAGVTVISPQLCPTLAELVAQGRIVALPRAYQPGDLADARLVISATDDPQSNQSVWQEAQERGILVNVADAPSLCTFYAPAVVRQGPVTVAIGTGGASPALARQLRRSLQEQFGPEYGPYLDLLKRVRTRLLTERRAHPDNARLFHRLVDSPLKDAVAQGDRARVVRLLHEILGAALSSPVLGELAAQAFKEPEG